MDTNSQRRSFGRRWLQARKAPITHQAYSPERIEISHPVFHGIPIAEDRLFQELAAALKSKGLDLGLVMMELHPGSKPEDYSWLHEQTGLLENSIETYEELRELLIYLHHNVLVRHLDRLDSMVNPEFY